MYPTVPAPVFDITQPATRAFPSLPDEGKNLITSIDTQDFELLERSIELVVQSQVFTPTGLEHALQLDHEVAEHVTDELEVLGVIERADGESHHEVTVEVEELSMLLVDMRLSRLSAGRLNAA